MDASKRPDTYTADDIIRMAGTFAADPEEGETAEQTAPAEQVEVKAFRGDREHILICEINAALHHVNSKNDPTEKHRRAAGRRLLETRDTVAPEKWERWCKANINLSFDRITKLTDSVERIRGSNRMHMAKKRAETPADDRQKGESAETPVVEEEQETKPMDFNELIQAGVEEGILPEAPAEAPAAEAVEPERPLSCKPNCEIEIDQNLRHGAACLEQARKAEVRVNDLKLSAQYAFKAAKVAWMEQPDRAETWSERCARVIPQASQRTVDALISGKAAEDTGADAEEYRKALALKYGYPYYTPEQRANIDKVFAEAKAQEVAARLKAAREAKKARANEPSISQTELQDREQTPSKAAVAQAARDEAEAIRVANGGKPAQTRMTGDHKALFDQWVELGRRMTEDELRDILVQASKAFDEAHAKAA